MTTIKAKLLISVLCGGLLLGTGATQADIDSARIDGVTWTVRGSWDHGYRGRAPWVWRHTLSQRWSGPRWHRPGPRRGNGSALIWWSEPQRHFWPTQRWTRGQCYRVEHLPFGRVRHIPLPKAACF